MVTGTQCANSAISMYRNLQEWIFFYFFSRVSFLFLLSDSGKFQYIEIVLPFFSCCVPVPHPVPHPVLPRHPSMLCLCFAPCAISMYRNLPEWIFFYFFSRVGFLFLLSDSGKF